VIPYANDIPAAPLDAPLSTEERLVADLAMVTEQRDRANLERQALREEVAQLRGQLLAARARIAALGELAARQLDEEVEAPPELLPCPLGLPRQIVGCGMALLGRPEAEHDACANFAQCHGILQEQAPGVLRFFQATERVVGP
jgi:hypothetical protein